MQVEFHLIRDTTESPLLQQLLLWDLICSAMFFSEVHLHLVIFPIGIVQWCGGVMVTKQLSLVMFCTS